MTEKIGSFVRAAKDLADKAQDKVEEGTGAVLDAAGRIGDVGQIGGEAAKTLTDDLNEVLPAIKRAGYHVQGIDVDVALPPKIAVHCHLDSEVSEADRTVLLESLEGRKIAALAIRMLFQVSDLQKNLAVGALKPSDVILELGVSPAVRVRYRERDTGVTT